MPQLRKLNKPTLTEREDSYIAGTKIGALKAAQTNKQKYGENFYKEIAAKGGKKGKADGTIKGFALMPVEKVRAAGAKGGRNSRRVKT